MKPTKKEKRQRIFSIIQLVGVFHCLITCGLCLYQGCTQPYRTLFCLFFKSHMEVGGRMCRVNNVGGFQGKDCSLLYQLVLFGSTKFKAHLFCLQFKQKKLLSQRRSKTNHRRNMRLLICRTNDFKFSWVHMEKVLHRFAGCCVLQNIPFF